MSFRAARQDLTRTHKHARTDADTLRAAQQARKHKVAAWWSLSLSLLVSHTLSRVFVSHTHTHSELDSPLKNNQIIPPVRF